MTEYFSALQRAEIAETKTNCRNSSRGLDFSALQRAEIAENGDANVEWRRDLRISVLFNEPKLLK